MGKFKTKFQSDRQDWETPGALFNPLNEMFQFDMDVAASSKNTKRRRFISKKEDAMKVEWHGTCWLNPPYGANQHTIKKWVKRAFEQSKKKNCSVIMLIPTRTNTNWWHDYCMKSDLILFIRGRPKFGGAKYGLPQPLAVVCFNMGRINVNGSAVSMSGVTKPVIKSLELRLDE